jgi:hypothetical protein
VATLISKTAIGMAETSPQPARCCITKLAEPGNMFVLACNYLSPMKAGINGYRTLFRKDPEKIFFCFFPHAIA